MAKHTLIYQDDWLIVVDKPFGLQTQSGKNNAPNLYDDLKAQFPYVGLHHRLDQPTSGLILFSISTEVNQGITQLFNERQIHRRYAAVCAGTLRTECAWSSPIDGKPACSNVFPLGQKNGMTAAHIELETGRTHQIRKHAARHRMPVVGDRRYGDQWGNAWPRLALHADQLHFTHPKTGVRHCIQSPIPDDLASLWALAGGS